MFNTATYIGLGWMLTGVTLMAVGMYEALGGPVWNGWVGLGALILLIETVLVLLWSRLAPAGGRTWMALPTALIGAILLVIALI